MKIGQIVRIVSQYGDLHSTLGYFAVNKLYVIKRKVGSKNTRIVYYLYPYDSDMVKYFPFGPACISEMYFEPVETLKLIQEI